MSLSLHETSVPVFRHMLGALEGLLAKAEAHAKAQGYDPEVLLHARLFPDMFPLVRQVQIACDSPKLCIARLSGIDGPVNDDSETTIAELKARIAGTLDYIRSVPREAIDGQEGKDVVLKFPGGELPFKGISYVVGFALPNFYFHVTTAYNILRANGVEIGKRDFIGTP